MGSHPSIGARYAGSSVNCATGYSRGGSPTTASALGPRLPGGGEHVVDRIGVLPVEVAGGEVAVGDDAGGIARAARTLGRGEVDAGDAAGSVHDLPDRGAGAA